jgi:NAD(P)-dependent dehydrogenase (short-subunit alcohol dehydrogenase family)
VLHKHESHTPDRREVVVVTGGTAGVGRAVVRRFAKDAPKIAVLARGQVGLDATAHEIRSAGGTALPIAVDVTDAEGVRRAADQIEEQLGPIDIWINNAMTTAYGRVTDIAPEEYRRITEVTYLGYVWGTQAALSKMRPRNRGTIVQVGSSLAYRGIPLQSAYCGAKHAIRAFTDSLRSELLHDQVDVHLTMVQLPSVNTPQFDHCLNKMDHKPQPVPPIFQPEIVAEAIHYAAHHRRREIYVGASTLELIYGQKLAPGVLDHYLAKKVWAGQLTSERADPAQPVNLFQPIERDWGAHGRFDGRSKESDLTSRFTSSLGAGGVRALVGAGALLGLGLTLRAMAGASRRAASTEASLREA